MVVSSGVAFVCESVVGLFVIVRCVWMGEVAGMDGQSAWEQTHQCECVEDNK